MPQRLNFANWLQEANPKEFKEYLKDVRSIERRYIRAYIEYLHNFKCEITEVKQIRSQFIKLNDLPTTRKGNTERKKKYIPFLS